jgi:predicted nucleic-acid-binding protein
MVGLDTNVLIRFIVQDDPRMSALAGELLESLTPDRPGFVSQVVMAETYWVLSRTYRLPRPACLQAVKALVETESLEFDDAEGVVRALSLAELGADFPDALIHSANELFGIEETVTFDRKAASQLCWRLLG